jgi:hypothetical protein
MSGQHQEGSEMTEEERQRMHEAYAEMGRKGGQTGAGGQARKMQMAQTGTPYTHKEGEEHEESSRGESERGEK